LGFIFCTWAPFITTVTTVVASSEPLSLHTVVNDEEMVAHESSSSPSPVVTHRSTTRRAQKSTQWWSFHLIRSRNVVRSNGVGSNKEDRLLARKALQRLQDPRHLQQARQLWATPVVHSKAAAAQRSHPTVSFSSTEVAPTTAAVGGVESRAFQTAPAVRKRFPSSTPSDEMEDCSLELNPKVDSVWTNHHEHYHRHHHHLHTHTAVDNLQRPVPQHFKTTTRRRRRGAVATNAAASTGVVDNPKKRETETNSQQQERNKNSTQNDSVYMCGVCGMVYSSLASATRHEEWHISNVVAAINGTTVPEQPETVSRVRELEYWNGTLIRANDDDDESIFDISPHVGVGGAYNNDDDDEQALLLSKEIRDHVVLADEALVDVVQRAMPLILTEAERDAEFELAWLATDKAHYDELARRAAARHVNPTNRYRSDEHDWRGTVRNKLLDAYQIMKESDGQKGRTDQYQRAHRKVRGGGSSAGSAAAAAATAAHQNPTQHNNARTMYVNVMVKNSVSVVRHELERWARQRWEQRTSSSPSPAPNNTTLVTTTNAPAQDLPLTRFEQFRHYTQRNVVKLAGIALASDFTVRLSNLSTKPMQCVQY
jgi:hypothetical protein